MGKIPQIYHTFALFHPPKMGNSMTPGNITGPIGFPHLKLRFFHTQDSPILLAWFFQGLPMQSHFKRLVIGLYHILHQSTKQFFFTASCEVWNSYSKESLSKTPPGVKKKSFQNHTDPISSRNSDAFFSFFFSFFFAFFLEVEAKKSWTSFLHL